MNNTVTKMIKYIKNYIEDEDLNDAQVRVKYGDDYKTLCDIITQDGTWWKFQRLYLEI